MRRVFLECEIADRMEVRGADAHHLHHVMRAKIGEKLLVADGAGRSAEAEVAGFADGKVQLHLVRRLAEAAESQAEIELFQCVPKGERMDFIVQKATELGVARIRPLLSQNVVVRYDEKKARARCERWQKIAAEAAKQCGRTRIPEVTTIEPLCAAIEAQPAKSGAEALRIFFYEEEKRCELRSVLEGSAARRILMLVGPEGGFAPEEAQLAAAHGFAAVTLGRRILRVDTAAIVALALVQYEKGDLGFAESSIDDLGLQGQPV